MDTWTDQELAAAVAAYRQLQADTNAGVRINKAQTYRDLSEKFGRSAKSWEYRMQNISHVLHEAGQEWIKGLAPASNVGAAMGGKLLDMLNLIPSPTLPTLSAGIAKERWANAVSEFDSQVRSVPVSTADERAQSLAMVVRRQGQPGFRSALLSAYGGRCAITGCDVVDVLEAAHIYPYRNETTNHPSNGLLLRADIHTLFDLYLLAVDPESRRVVLPERLAGSVYGPLAGTALRRPHADGFVANAYSLEWHRQQCDW